MNQVFNSVIYEVNLRKPECIIILVKLQFKQNRKAWVIKNNKNK